MVLARKSEDLLLPLSFALRSNPGAYAVLLGAGVSASAGVPTAWGVLEELTGRLAAIRAASPPDLEKWFTEEFGEERTYESLLEKLAPTQTERQRLMLGFFQKRDEDGEQAKPTGAHRALARLVADGYVRIIVTLNFDRLMETALRELGIEPTVVASPGDAEGLPPLHTLNACVVHLHGDYLSPTAMLNTATELAQYQPETTNLLDQVLANYGLVIAGWSARYDPVLREHIAKRYPCRYTLTWIDSGDEAEDAMQLRLNKQAVRIEDTADQAFGFLIDSVQAMKERDARHPDSIPNAAAFAKRALAGRSVAIPLHDAMQRELSVLYNHRDFNLASFEPAVAEANGGYQQMVERSMEAAKMSAVLVAATAFWGDVSTNGWWLGDIRRFSDVPNVNGSTALIELRRVAALVLFHAAGVAATGARRWDVLHSLFSLTGRTPWRNSDREGLARTLEPNSLLPAFGTGALRSTLHGLLIEATGLSEQTLDEAWQQWELLRAGAASLDKPGLGQAVLSYLKKFDSVAEVESSFEPSERDTWGRDNPPTAVQQSRQARDDALLEIARQIRPLLGPHLLLEDRFRGWVTPAGEELITSLLRDGVEPRIFPSPWAMDLEATVALLRGVSVAAEWRAEQISMSMVGGFLPSTVWLDDPPVRPRT